MHGARIVAEVVGDEAVFNEWRQEMEGMAGRIRVGAAPTLYLDTIRCFCRFPCRQKCDGFAGRIRAYCRTANLLSFFWCHEALWVLPRHDRKRPRTAEAALDATLQCCEGFAVSR